MDLLSHDEENKWVFKLTETETAQLEVNGSPVGTLYTVGTNREATVTLRVEEKDAES